MAVANDPGIRTLSTRLVEAWQHGDWEVLAALLTDDFRLVGPLGFVLTKNEWLDQHRSGALVTHEIAWEGEDLRAFGGCAIAIGTLSQKAEYRGQPANGRFRVTQIAVEGPAGPQFAGMHFSPIAQLPAS